MSALGMAKVTYMGSVWLMVVSRLPWEQRDQIALVTRGQTGIAGNGCHHIGVVQLDLRFVHRACAEATCAGAVKGGLGGIAVFLVTALRE